MIKALIHVPGGKELRVLNNQVPDELYNALQRIAKPEIIHFYEGPLDLTDELHAKLHKAQQFNTFVSYKIPFGALPESKETEKYLLDSLHMASIVIRLESVFTYQILKLEIILPDDYTTDYLKEAPKDDAA